MQVVDISRLGSVSQLEHNLHILYYKHYRKDFVYFSFHIEFGTTKKVGIYCHCECAKSGRYLCVVVVIISEAIADCRTSVVYVTGILCKMCIEARMFKINSVYVVFTISNCLSSLAM